MSTPAGSRTPRPAVADFDETTRRFWRGLASAVAPGPALWGFGLTLAILAVALNLGSGALERGLRALSVVERGVDVFEDNGPGAYQLRDYLAGPPPPPGPVVALLGASCTATTGEPDLSRRLDRSLPRELSVRSGRPWRCEPFASDGFDTWSDFFLARILRHARRPDVMVVGLDIFEPSDANPALVLAAGARLRWFTPGELLPAIAYNRQPLYRAEAAVAERLDAWLPALEIVHRARPRGLVLGAVSLARRGFRPAPRPRAASWLEVPETKAALENVARGPKVPYRIPPAAMGDLERLGAELERDQRAGIRVLVVTFPRNPRLLGDFGPAAGQLREWADRHHLELADYWRSGVVPTEDFVDYSHFTGEGADIMARILAERILGGRRP